MNSILRWNPEFAKNLWLEFSPQRLIAMPAIIILVTAIILVNFPSETMWNLVYAFAMGGIVIIGMVWGMRSAGASILDEYNERTWDWQRMSVIGPWKLAIGKLFGSTIYSWYGAMICLVVFVFSGLQLENPSYGLRRGILLIISMVLVHGFMILLSLQMIRKGDGRSKIRSNSIFVIGIVLIIILFNIFERYLLFGISSSSFWYGIETNGINITILTALFYGAWVVAGVYRALRSELQYSDAPKWWLAFIISSVIFQFGFFTDMDDLSLTGKLSACLAFAAFQLMVITYLLALSEPKDIVNFRLLQNNLRANNYKAFFENIPLWLFTLPVAFAAGFVSVSLLAVSGGTFFGKIELDNIGTSYAFLFACYGFAIRDLGILLLLNFSKRARRADAAMLVYLLLLYVLLPFLTQKLHIGPIFYPDPDANPFVMVLFPVLEAAVVLFMLKNRWSEIHRKSIA